MRPLAILAMPAILAACATTAMDDGDNMKFREPGGTCDAAPAQSYIGQRATADLGGEALRLTGASSLRWVPPRSAVTMDFREDRLNIEYDDDYKITRIRCG